MTTIDERREWMRAGCPVSEPEEPEPVAVVRLACRDFGLIIGHFGGSFHAECFDCGERQEVFGITERDGLLQGQTATLTKIVEWMNVHGKGRAYELWSELTRDKFVEAWIQEWIRASMLGHELGMRTPAMEPFGWRITFKPSAAKGRQGVQPIRLG